MGDDAARKVGWARRWLSIFATGFAILLAIVVGLLLVLGNGDLSSKDARFALGLNLLASALFAAVFSGLATWVLERNQSDTIREMIDQGNSATLAQIAGIRELIDQGNSATVAQIAGLHPTYLPIAHFPPSDSFGIAYNKAVMKSIDRAQSYEFCGPSARYVVARLKMVPTCPGSVRVAMIGPHLRPSIIRRAADREKWVSQAGKNVDELEQIVRQELIATIVSLFDFRRSCPVHIAYTSDTVVYRMELTDDAVFFSWFHGPSSANKEMPEAVQFRKESMYYQVLRQEVNRKFEVAEHKITFDAHHTEADLLAHLRDLTGRDYEPADLVSLRAFYESNTEKLRDFLRDLEY